MKEFFDGSGIYWYSSQRSIRSACTKWEEYVNLVVDIFFSKEVLRMSCSRGLNKGRKLKDTFTLCQPIVEAIIGKFTSEILFFHIMLHFLFFECVLKRTVLVLDIFIWIMPHVPSIHRIIWSLNLWPSLHL